MSSTKKNTQKLKNIAIKAITDSNSKKTEEYLNKFFYEFQKIKKSLPNNVNSKSINIAHGIKHESLMFISSLIYDEIDTNSGLWIIRAEWGGKFSKNSKINTNLSNVLIDTSHQLPQVDDPSEINEKIMEYMLNNNIATLVYDANLAKYINSNKPQTHIMKKSCQGYEYNTLSIWAVRQIIYEHLIEQELLGEVFKKSLIGITN